MKERQSETNEGGGAAAGQDCVEYRALWLFAYISRMAVCCGL